MSHKGLNRVVFKENVGVCGSRVRCLEGVITLLNVVFHVPFNKGLG